MIRLFVAVACLSLLAGLPVQAASPASSSHHYLKSVKKIARKKPVVQRHVSFIPDSKPSETMVRLRLLTGRVVQQQEVTIPKPVIALPEPMQAKTQSITALTLKTPKRWRWNWQWPTLDRTPRPPKLRQQPVILTANNSWVVPLPPADAAQLSGFIAAAIQEQIPDIHTNLILLEPPVNQASNTLTPNLKYTLKTIGYSLTSDTQAPSAVRIRYRISNFDKTLLVRVKINGVETARLYERAFSGALVAASPTSINKGH